MEEMYNRIDELFKMYFERIINTPYVGRIPHEDFKIGNIQLEVKSYNIVCIVNNIIIGYIESSYVWPIPINLKFRPVFILLNKEQDSNVFDNINIGEALSYFTEISEKDIITLTVKVLGIIWNY